MRARTAEIAPCLCGEAIALDAALHHPQSFDQSAVLLPSCVQAFGLQLFETQGILLSASQFQNYVYRVQISGRTPRTAMGVMPSDARGDTCSIAVMRTRQTPDIELYFCDRFVSTVSIVSSLLFLCSMLHREPLPLVRRSQMDTLYL
jgi:hypothetical protein